MCISVRVNCCYCNVELKTHNVCLPLFRADLTLHDNGAWIWGNAEALPLSWQVNSYVYHKLGSAAHPGLLLFLVHLSLFQVFDLQSRQESCLGPALCGLLHIICFSMQDYKRMNFTIFDVLLFTWNTVTVQKSEAHHLKDVLSQQTELFVWKHWDKVSDHAGSASRQTLCRYFKLIQIITMCWPFVDVKSDTKMVQRR